MIKFLKIANLIMGIINISTGTSHLLGDDLILIGTIQLLIGSICIYTFVNLNDQDHV